MTTWADVDEPVLLYLATEMPSSMPPGMNIRLVLAPETPSEEVTGLTDREVDASMLRLHSAGIIDMRDRALTASSATWYRPRITAYGSMVLGRWPDTDVHDLAEIVQACLAALADGQTKPSDAADLRRAAGVLGNLASGVATKVVVGAAASAAAGI